MNPYQSFLGEKDPMQVLPKTAAQIAKLIDGLTPRQLAKRPAPDKWSIAEIIGHLADTELVMATRCKWIASEDNPALAPFDQNLWATVWTKTKEPFTESLERLRTIR